MQKSYTRNYVQIYFWKFFAFALQFLSMFIVVPRLTSMQAIYGIFTICNSVTIFLSYTDLGFMGASYKYAAEALARDDREREMKLIGFATFISLVLVGGFMCFLIVLVFNPQILIKGLTDPHQILIASQLFLILLIFSPLSFIGQMISAIFGIRLEDYIFSAIQIIASLIQILSVFYFFTTDRYDIVGYFLFSQLLSLVVYFICGIIAKKRYNYNITYLFKSVKYTREVYAETKSYAFNALYSTIMFILYFEIDLFVIGPLAGPTIAAIYAIGYSILTNFRSLTNILFGSFFPRYNHFIGQDDIEGLKKYHKQIIIFTMPLIITSTFLISFFAKPFIYTWVGNNYAASVPIMQFFTLCWVLHFVALPASFLLSAQVRLKELYFVMTLNVLIYWIGIFFTFQFFGVLSFAIFKCVTFMVTGIFYFEVTVKFLNWTPKIIFKEIILPILLPVLFLYFSSVFIIPFLPLEKGTLNLLIVLIVIGIVGVIALGIFFVTSKGFRVFGITYFKQILESFGLKRKSHLPLNEISGKNNESKSMDEII